MAAEIVLFCERKKWHGRSISRAFQARGIRPLTVSLAACGFSTATKTGLAIPGLGDHLPKGALVLFVPGGSFEQVTLYLGVLHALRELWRHRCGTMRAPSSAAWTNPTTTFFLQQAGIPTPWTWTGTSREAATRDRSREARARLQARAETSVRGARRRLAPDLPAPDDLAPPEEVNGAYYLQEFIASADGMHRDWRIFVSAGRVVAVHDQARLELDHQYQARRPRRGRHPLARACRSCSPRRVLRRRRLCRRRHHSGPLGRASRARGELDAGVAGVAAGHADAHRRLYRGAVP